MSVSAIAQGLEMHPRTVREWIDRGVIPKDCPDALAAARAMLKHYQAVSSGHRAETSDGEVLDLTLERARLAKAQSETAELKNAELRHELVRVDEIKSEWSRRVLSWKERIRAVPAAATVHVPGFTKSMARSLLSLIDETLTELADDTGDAPRKGRSRRGRKAPQAAA